MKLRSPLRKAHILFAIFFYNSVVGFTSGDKPGSESTWVDFIAGFGSLTQVVRDCNGNVIRHDDYPFVDGGASIHHTIGYAAFTGKINTFRVTRKTFNISNSYADTSWDPVFSSTGVGAAFGLNAPFAEFDAGVMYFNNIANDYFPIRGSHFQPMWKLRIGFEDSWYFSSSYFYNNTLLAQGGRFDIGFGFHISGTQSALWLGFGEEPYSDDQLIFRADIVPSDWKAHFLFSGNIGFGADGSTEFGASLGLRVDLK